MYKLEGHSDLARDPKTNSIVNVNSTDYEQYIARRSVKNEEVQIHDLEIVSEEASAPGVIKEFTKDSLSVSCGDGIIKIKAVKFPGKKVISSIDFFNAKRDIISSGDILVWE